MNTDFLSVFAEPPREFAMVPILRYNERLRADRLRFQLQQVRKQGLGGVFVETGKFHGLDTPRYLSAAWWRDIGLVIRLCEEVGIHYWIYDDEDWPSASAGGQLPGKNARFQSKYLRASTAEVEGPAVHAVRTGRGFLGAVAVPASDRRGADERIVVGPRGAKNGRVKLRLGAGRWRVHVFSAGVCRGWFLPLHPDACDAELAKAFVRMVHGGYERHFRDKLGRVIRGTFTDEVTIPTAGLPWMDRFPYAPAFPWSAKLPEEYRQRTGRDLLGDLPDIISGEGKRGLQGRADFWAALGAMYARNYYGLIAQWCERHGMISTGHLMGEEDMQHQVALSGGDPMELQAQQHMPGIDWIHPFEHYSKFPIAVPKLAASVAHLHGKTRVMSESFAAAGWGLSFSDMMRILNYQFACGINFIVPITLRYTLQDKKHYTFYPPGIAVQQPYFEHFRPMADYVSRLCYLNAIGHHDAEVAVLHPATEARTLFPDEGALKRLTASFNGICEELARQQIDFDILDEASLARGRPVPGLGLRIGNEAYRAIFVPRMKTIRAATLRRLQHLAESGVRVVWLSELPQVLLDAGSDKPLADLRGQLRRRGAREREGRALTRGGHELFRGDVSRCLARLRPGLGCAVRDCNSRELIVQHRRIHREDHFLCFNRSRRWNRFRVTFAAQGHVRLLDAMTGQVCPAPPARAVKGGTELAFTLMPFEAIWVWFPREAVPCAPTLRWAELRAVKTLSGPWRFSARSVVEDPNQRHNFSRRDGRLRGRVPPIPETIECGDWCRLGLAHLSGVGTYERTFSWPIGTAVPGERTVLDLGRVAHTARVWVNGREVGTAVHPPFRFDITEVLVPGENTLRVDVANTLVNYYSQFKELRKASYAHGGTGHHSKVSGLLGPVRICRWSPAGRENGR